MASAVPTDVWTDWALAPGGAGMAIIARRVRQAGGYFVTTDAWERHAIFINTVLASIVVKQVISCRDRGLYKLHAFVLMPEHLHLLITPSDETTIEKAVQMIKGGSAHRIGVEKPQPTPVWHRGFHDRWIRDAEQFWAAKAYIEQNPVKAGIVERPEDYEWSSAKGKVSLDLSRYQRASG